MNNVEAQPGEKACLKCQLGGSPAASKVEWFKNNEPLKESDSIKFELTDDVCVLNIQDVGPSDSGVYRCVATNDSGSSATTAELSVQEPDLQPTLDEAPITRKEAEPEVNAAEEEKAPVFTEEVQDGSVTVLDGGNVRLEARIGGVPPPEVEWFKNDTPVQPGEHFVEIVDGDRHCLDIVHVSPSDSGTYKCVGTNHLGTVTRVYSLDIEGKKICFFCCIKNV